MWPPPGSRGDSAHSADSPQPLGSPALYTGTGGPARPAAVAAPCGGTDLVVALKGRLAELKALEGGRKSGGSCGSAEDSAAGLALAGGSGKCSTFGDSAGTCGDAALDLDGSAWYDDEEGDPYGADTLRPPWRRHEAIIAGWILGVFVLSMVLNAGIGAVHSRRAARLQASLAAGGAPAAAWLPSPPPPLGRKRRRPSPLAPPMPPSPPAPPPAFCDVAPPHLARWRYSNLTAVFPGKLEHYSANLIQRQGEGGRSYPAYYNGVVPRNCLVGIQATYTCSRDDNPCNYAPTVSSSYCETACTNDAEGCAQIAGLQGHPLAARVCGLFRRSKPACTHIGFTANRERQLRAYYKLNLCQAPPGPRPPPRPPLPPAAPPPPAPPPVEYYYA